MQRLGEWLLMLSGAAALGAYFYLPSPSDDAADLAEVTRISVAADRPQPHETIIRKSSPAARVSGTRIAHASAAAPPSTPAPAKPLKPGTWTTVVTSGPSSGALLRSSAPGDAETRYELARDLQRELKRVGCYGGDINGAWTPATKRAMAVFVDRANATLPIDQPDYILLSLVQSHSDVVCSAECPSGQAMADSGRCVPNAVIAQAAKKAKRLEERRAAEARLAGERSAVAVAASEPAPPPGQEQLPWLDSDGRSLVAAAPAPRPEPLPGRMAIGAPPPRSVAAISPADRGLPPVGNGVDAAAPKIVVLAPDDVSDDDLSQPNANADGPALNGDQASAPPKAKKSARHRDRGERRRSYGYGYGYGGRRRHGDPRPGTMRYNIVQALGGIY